MFLVQGRTHSTGLDHRSQSFCCRGFRLTAGVYHHILYQVYHQPLVTLNPMVEADVLPFQIVSDLSPRILGPSPSTPAAAMGHELGNELFAVASWLG